MLVHRIGFSAKQGKAENQSLRLLEAPRRTNLNTTGKMCEPTHVCDFIIYEMRTGLKRTASGPPEEKEGPAAAGELGDVDFLYLFLTESGSG